MDDDFDKRFERSAGRDVDDFAPLSPWQMVLGLLVTGAFVVIALDRGLR
jgi:hypothetical protein